MIAYSDACQQLKHSKVLTEVARQEQQLSRPSFLHLHIPLCVGVVLFLWCVCVHRTMSEAAILLYPLLLYYTTLLTHDFETH